MHWIALQPLPDASTAPTGSPTEVLSDPLVALGWWALQYTPKVAQVEGALVLEVSASERLWGGAAALCRHIYTQKKPVAQVQYARGATSLIAIARLGSAAKPRTPPDDLPLHTLLAAGPHLGTLEKIGCTQWGQLRALPRGGVVRRFGAPLLDALDRAYGLKPEVYPWLVLPEVFEAQLELSAQVETAPALLFGASRLLKQLQLWLQLRHRGVLALALQWTMDARRNTATQGELLLRTAEPTGDIDHLQRLLAENLARVTLPGQSESLLPDEQIKGDSLHQMLERLSARLGAPDVLQYQAQADHRPEHMQCWSPALNAMQLVASCVVNTGAGSLKGIKNTSSPHSATPGARSNPAQPMPSEAALHPTWLLPTPLKLALRDQQPLYHGPLTLVAGPHRVESGWWVQGECALRDYFLARSEHMGLLWIYRDRLMGQGEGAEAGVAADWYLQGVFA
ncbi:DNA polymerase Y family protein [Rhodoferax sp. PAMC 29310]|uniref:DNA polymerase Y family protein n=1 Tax=Rhodoferax sp. PAMC 29310 TaxID=2822760 RepID=UPI001B331B50|nr:DNA polymerase Y family protein [Rhodoferax sp. PAMC 29310]